MKDVGNMMDKSINDISLACAKSLIFTYYIHKNVQFPFF